MGKRKAKPLLAVQGIVHLTESFVQPSQESGLLNTVNGNTECPGLILAPNYGYGTSASLLAKKAEEEGVKEDQVEEKDNEEEKTDTENIENETPEASESENSHENLSVSELVRHIGGAKDKPLLRCEVVEDRPESEQPAKPSTKGEADDAETCKFYESLGITRPNNSKVTELNTISIEVVDNVSSEVSNEVDESEKSISESIADFYRSYQTEYVYSVPSDPYSTQRLEFSVPSTSTLQEQASGSGYSIIEVARRAQKVRREYEAKKATFENQKSNKTAEEDEAELYDPLPMEIIPSDNTRGPKVRPEDLNLVTYWDYVQENPHDFYRWTFLITYAENTTGLDEVRKVYSAFLPLYPYCFGYWKRYSDIEKAHNYFQRALTILQRGLEFIPLSVDLWMSYLKLYSEIHAHNKDFQDIFQEQYEMAINCCGMEFRSDSLWDSFIQWQMHLQKLKNAFVVYKRLLQVPTRLYNRHWDNFKCLVRDHHPRDFLSHDDYENVRKRGCKVFGFQYKPEPEIEPGEIRKTTKPEDQLMEYVKQRVVNKFSKVQGNTAVETDKRWDYEDKIKRPYFHVKPLDKAQLRNWEEYLNYELKEGNHDRIVLLFERCLIACANYERFWCMYTRYLEKYHRKNPQLDSSTHLQPSKVNVEIVSQRATEEEETLIATVDNILSTLVSEVAANETKENTIFKEVIESILSQLDENKVEIHCTNTSPKVDESAVNPENLCGHSESKSELPLNSGNNNPPSANFAALLQIPTFPAAQYRWHEVVRDIYKRASLIHCPRKPTIRLQWAAFEEEIGNMKEARELIAYVLEWYPHLLEAKLQLLDLLRRCGYTDELIELYERFMKEAKTKELLSLISMKYSRFLFKEMGFADKALMTLRAALKKDGGNHRIYAQVYEICYHRFPADKKGAYAALELAFRSNKLSPEHKLIFARKRLHFFQEHSDLVKYRNAVDDLYELEGVIREKEAEEKRWLEFDKHLKSQNDEETNRHFQPFPVPQTSGQKPAQNSVAISFESLNDDAQVDVEEPLQSTDVGPSVPYSAVPPVQEYLDPNYGYSGRHPDFKLAEHLGHKEYQSIEAKGYPEDIKDTAESLELLRERKRKNPLYIVPPKGSFYVNSDSEVPGAAKRVRLEAPVLLSELITPNSSPCVNVPDWFVKEGGELCLSETNHGFSIIRYWPHFLSEDGNKKMFKSLRKSVKWQQKKILTSYGTWCHIPRLVSWLGPCEYSHTGMVLNKCEQWTPEILDLLHRLVQFVNYEFNSCSLNLYRTGHDSNAWHADIHPALGSNPPIASVSLGALRTFEMKRKRSDSTNFIRFPLFPGSLLIMEGATQADWLHQVPKEPSTKAERLNLTFRIMHALEDEDPEAQPSTSSRKKEETNIPPLVKPTETLTLNELKSKEKPKSQQDPLHLPFEKPDVIKPWEMQTKIKFCN